MKQLRVDEFTIFAVRQSKCSSPCSMRAYLMTRPQQLSEKHTQRSGRHIYWQMPHLLHLNPQVLHHCVLKDYFYIGQHECFNTPQYLVE
eukprot:5669444-Amphidinium_carterae.1